MNSKYICSKFHTHTNYLIESHHATNALRTSENGKKDGIWIIERHIENSYTKQQWILCNETIWILAW